MEYDLIIIGAGPAGLSAGIYAQRAKLNTLLLEQSYVSGGQVMDTYEVENYPGMPGISGMDLAEAFKNHADRLELPFVRTVVKEIYKEEKGYCVETGKEAYHTKTVIIATGAQHRQLGIAGEEELSGMGVSYCATCDGAFFKEKTVAVIGGGDVALEDAIFLSNICEKVYVIHRRDAFRGAAILQERLQSQQNVEILWDTVADEVVGSSQVEAVDVRNVKTDSSMRLEVDGVFVAVGTMPNTNLVRGFLELDESGYIKAGEDCVTSQPGIFAAGDIRTKLLRQIITAAADGACAVASVQNYLIRNAGGME